MTEYVAGSVEAELDWANQEIARLSRQTADLSVENVRLRGDLRAKPETDWEAGDWEEATAAVLTEAAALPTPPAEASEEDATSAFRVLVRDIYRAGNSPLAHDPDAMAAEFLNRHLITRREATDG